LRTAAVAATGSATIAVARHQHRHHRAADDFHRLAVDPKVGRRDAAATIHEREFERLAVGQIGQAGLLDRGNVNEHILAAVIANHEAEAFLRIEEFDDALAFATTWGRHAATRAATGTAAAKTTAAAASAAAESTTAAAAAAVAAITATAAVAAGRTATEAATIGEPPRSLPELFFWRKRLHAYLVRDRPGRPYGPLSKPMPVQTSLCPVQSKPTRWAHRRNGRGASCSRTVHAALQEKWRLL